MKAEKKKCSEEAAQRKELADENARLLSEKAAMIEKMQEADAARAAVEEELNRLKEDLKIEDLILIKLDVKTFDEALLSANETTVETLQDEKEKL